MTKPLFTTKHYKAIAEKLKIEVDSQPDMLATMFSLEEVMNWLSDIFQQDNSKFDEEKFCKAIVE